MTAVLLSGPNLIGQEKRKMHSVWAVARNTLAQAFRMKIAVVIIIMLLLVLPFMSMIMIGDGTLQGKLQTFISYGLSLTSVLLCILTICVSAFTLTNDIKRKHIFLVVTKPICRFQILCGKLLGLILLDAFLLSVFAAIIYGLTYLIPVLTDADAVELAKAQREFFTARKSLMVEVDEEQVNRRILKTYEELERTGQLPDTMTKRKILSTLRGQELLKQRAVEVGTKKVWEFENVPQLSENDSLFVRYKYEVSSSTPDEKVYATWLIGDYRQREQFGPGNWESPVYSMSRSDAVKVFQEFEVPANAVASDGYLAVVFHNLTVNQTTVIPQEVQVLFRAGSFTGNFIRVTLLILARLIFLAVLGISVSTWLSFPVAILICIVVYSIGMVNGFIVDSFSYLEHGFSVTVYSLTLKPLMWFLPRFDGQFNPTQFMITAKFLNWQFLAKVYGLMVFIKAAVLLLSGVWIFSNREIAKTTV